MLRKCFEECVDSIETALKKTRIFAKKIFALAFSLNLVIKSFHWVISTMNVYFWTFFFTFLSFFFDSVGILEEPDSYRYETIGLSADKFTIQQYCEELTKQLSPMTFKVI